jgi:predicted nucleic acid-binding Zn ribbon protein
VGNSISGVLKKFGLERKVKEYEIINKWPELVGGNVASATSAERINDEILFVKVKNSSWRHELIYSKGYILSKIEIEIGKGIIKDIRYI